MRQEQIRKTPRRRPRRAEAPAQLLVPCVPGSIDADDLLARIDQVLEAAS